MSTIFHASFYRFFHSRTVKYFFLIYSMVCLLSLFSAFETPIDMFVQSISDMTMPALGLSVFSAVYVGAQFKSRTMQNQIVNGHKRSALVITSFITLALILVLLIFINAAMPSMLFYLKEGALGSLRGTDNLVTCTDYLLRLIFPGTLFTLARASGLFVFPFLFRDTTKTMLVSIAYSFLVGSLTQRNRLTMPYRYYSLEAVSANVDMMVLVFSALMIALSCLMSYLVFRRASLK